MDPVTVASGCVGLLTGVAHLTNQISSFVSSVRDARKDMAAVSGELVSLSLCLETLRDDSIKIKYPEVFHQNLLTVLKNCDTVTTEMTTLLGKLSSANLTRKIQWSAMGKDDMNKLRSSLESHKSALEIGLDMTSLLIISAVKSEVAEVKADTAQIPSIKQDTSQIEGLVQQIGLLRLQLENIRMNDAKAQHLQMFLDQSTTYAATVMDSIHEEDGKPYATDSSDSDEFENEQQVPTTIDSTKSTYATDGSDSDEVENEQQVPTTINSAKSMVTKRVSSSPEQPNHTLPAGTSHLSSTESDRTDGIGPGPPNMIYDVAVPNSMPQARLLTRPLLNDNRAAAKSTHDSRLEPPDRQLTVGNYAAQSTANTSTFSGSGKTENPELSGASLQPAKAREQYPLISGVPSYNRALHPCRDHEAIQKATLLRNAMTEKQQDRLYKSLEVAIRGRRSFADRFRKGPWVSDVRDDFDKIKELLDRGANPNRLSYGYDLCTIEMGEGGRRLEVLVLLLMRGASFQPSEAGPWLVEAMRSGKFTRDPGKLKYGNVMKALVTDLLDYGVSPNAKNAGGTSALTYACRFRYPTSVQLLLDRGAIADDAALVAAVHSGRYQNVVKLLGHKTTFISTAGKELAAKKAADMRDWEVVDILLKHDASLAVNTPVVQRAIAAHRRRLTQSSERTPS